MTPISAELLARIRTAADPRGHGHRIELTRLVDGEYTYTANCCGETREFPDQDTAYDWVRDVKAKASEAELVE